MTAVRTPLRTGARRTVAPAVNPGGAGARTRLSVASAPPATRPVRALWIIGVVAVLVAVLVVTASQALLVQGQDRLDELQRSLSEQERIAERQQLQLAELQAPERVVAAATDRLGMVAPTDVVHLRSDVGDDAGIAVAPRYPLPGGTETGPEAGETVDAAPSEVDPSPAAAPDELAAGDSAAAAGG